MVATALPDTSASAGTSPAVAASPPAEARDVWFSYAPGRPVLRGVSLSVAPGTITMLLGASGSGKTTLLKLVKGLLRPQQGSITVLGGPPPAHRGEGRLDPRVAYIPQQLGLVRSVSVLDNTLTGMLSRTGTLPSMLKLFPRDSVRRARGTLEMLGIGHKAGERVYALSGGERQRVAIARALMQEPQIIVADEFVSQLDPVTSREIMDIIRGIARRGVTVLMTSHELDIVSRYADRVVMLRDGEKTLDCAAREVGDADLGALMRS